MLHRTFDFRAALMLAPLLALAAAAAPAEAQLATLASNDTIRESSSSQPADSRPRGLVTREELIVDRLQRLGIDNPDPYPRKPSSRADSVRWERDRRQAWGGPGRRVIVSVYERMLWVAENGDTLLSAPVGVGMGVARKGRFSYDFSTPLGRRTVLAKEENPIWTPPDWHYWGQARRVRPFPAGGVALADGRRVVRRGEKIGYLAKGEFEQIPPERDLLFDGVLYIPPFGTVNRQIPDVLGRFKLDTGDGILIHGTNDPVSIGFPATHGCIRLDDAELEELYALVPVGTQVFIY